MVISGPRAREGPGASCFGVNKLMPAFEWNRAKRLGGWFSGALLCCLLALAGVEAGEGEDENCADANGDSRVDLGDAVHVLTWLFRGGEAPRCGELSCIDVNSDSEADLSDAIHILEWLFLGGENPDCPGPQPVVYEIGHVVLFFEDSPGSPGEIPVDVFYPALAAGEGRPAASGRFPLVVFGHGYGMEALDYAYLWETLVPAGYVFATSDRLSDEDVLDLEDYALDLRFVLSRLEEEGAEGDSILFQHLDGASALMGHSSGGGASVLAAADALAREGLDLRTVLLLAPLGAVGYPILGDRHPAAEAGLIEVPALVLEGEKDCTTPPVFHSRPIFGALPARGSSFLVNLPLGDHCGFADEDGPTTLGCGVAEVGFCNPFFPFINFQGETLGSIEQTRVVGTLVRPWLDRHLKGDPGAHDLFGDRLSTEDVTWRRR